MKETNCYADSYRSFTLQLAGRVRSRYHPEYPGWLRQSAWNKRNFGRMPEMIVRAQSVEDVVDTINFAYQHRHPLSVSAGGHSYSGCFLRNNSILLDISALREIQVDPDNSLAQIGPGVTARELSHQLKRYGLAFPTGHAGQVALSGFLLGGGMGINTTAWGGMSVFNIEAVDLITADGQLCHASAEENIDLFWAARGAGPNAFFVVVRFYLKCHPMPKAIANHVYQLPYNALSILLEVIEGQTWDPRIQIMIGLMHPQPDQPHTLILNIIAFTDNEQESAALQRSLIQLIPSYLITVLTELPNSSFEDIYLQGEGMLIGRHFRSDNIITDRIQAVGRVFDVALPEQPSPAGITLLTWRGEQTFPDAAYSVKGRFFVSTYLQWYEEQDDLANRQWLLSLYDKLAELSCGSYINEFDLESRAQQVECCYLPKNWQRLCELRQQYDPFEIFINVKFLQDE
ncbi:FAD-binding oxidoreductase [Serratia sp. NA_112.1]|uniref:FAD-binding oxidoreductase n=1 Tax=unclassified Serratia (in: enterobacteria) TaxID=2647522 RepID=UPI004046D2B8